MSTSYMNISAWDGEPIKLSILIPARDTVHTHFAYCLSQLIKTTIEVGIEPFLFFDMSTILLKQRESLIEKAKEVNSDYVLWLDSDMMFPSTTAVRLLNHKKNIVGCNYMKRSLPLKPVAYKKINDWGSFLPLTEKKYLIEVEGVGLGCILMKTNIFNKIEKPYFEFTYLKESDDWLGEDFNLCKKINEAGDKIYIDTVLSREIKHVGNYAFGCKNKTK